MKKASKKRVIVSVALAALLFAAAITAYAASWHDSGRFSGSDYSGDYTATMDLTADRASASLSVSNYIGVAYAGGGTEIRGYAFTNTGKRVDFFNSSGMNYCDAYTAEKPDDSFMYAQCDFYYMSFLVTSHVLYAS